MRFKTYIYLFAILITIAACSKKDEPKLEASKPGIQSAAHEVTVREVINVTEYTYLRVTEGNKEYWMAAPLTDIKVGAILTYNSAMEMKGFESKELKKKFEVIYFVDNLETKLGYGSMNKPQKPVIAQENITVEKIADGITIADLFNNLNKYSNKVVKIKGQVVKLNTGIMGKNWIHIQDGTKSGDNFDLTITTNDMVGKNDIIVATGKIVLDKDFGYGYSYKVIMEDAKIQGGSKPNKMMSM